MTFAQRINRQPIPFDAAQGAEAAAPFAGLGAAVAGLLAGAAGCSPYLRDLIATERDWLKDALSRSPESVRDATLARLRATAPDALGADLRQAKRRIALLAALADLGGVWPLETVTGALTGLADAAVHLCVTTLVADEIRRGKLPGQTPADAKAGAGMVVLAMGKMGAAELNYSSDIDLICLFDDVRYGADAPEARAAFIRVTRRMTALLSDVTAGGYVFRTDLRLRPDASVTPVCLSMAAAESYYEAEGRTWERAAYIKARSCGGDLQAGARFLAALTPFVWRRYLDYAAIQDAHDMRLRIRDHKGLNGALSVEGHNIKLGQGGIREIEFFTQTRQLIAGGRDPGLRVRTTTGGLAALAAAGWVPGEVAAELSTHYAALRELEHRLQMVGDAQTHSMPATAEGIARIAAFCGQADPAAFRRALQDRLARVAELTEGFFAPRRPSVAGPVLSDQAAAIVERWRSYPALRSARAVESFKRLRPVILERLHAAADPDEALLAFDGFLSGLPAGVQLFALFEGNPQLVDLLADICATAPVLARHLARNSGVLEAVIGGSFFAPWPGPDRLRSDLASRLDQQGDYEQRLVAAREWLRDWHFHVGVHHLRGLIGAEEAGRLYADLAQVVVAELWRIVIADFSRRHGPPPGAGAVVIGMGSLGAGRLNAGSDLDLLVVFDAAGVEQSAGARPLAARPYYARLTQAMVTALTAQMQAGRLYEVDMRLRPSGRQGPVATSIASWRDYQMTEAWTWEHLALTRARVVAGPAGLAGQVDAIRAEVLAAKADPATVLAGLADMRARLAAARGPGGAWDARGGPGRLMDIDLFGQAGALVMARAAPPARSPQLQLGLCVPAGLCDAPVRDRLARAARLFWSLHATTRLLSDRPLDTEALGAGGRALLLRETGMTDLAALAQALADSAQDCHAAISAALDRLPAAAPGSARPPTPAHLSPEEGKPT